MKLTALVSAADHAANSLQRVPREPYDAATNPAVTLLEQFGPKGTSKRFAVEIPGLLEEAPGLADTLTG